MIREWIAHFLINALMLNKVSPVDHAETIQALIRSRMECDQLRSYANSLDVELVACRREIEDLRNARRGERNRRAALEAEFQRRMYAAPSPMPMTVPRVESQHYNSERERLQRQAMLAAVERVHRSEHRRRGSIPRTFNGTEPEDL